MSLLIILVLLAGSCFGDNRIVGGNEISIDYYPSIVQVEFREPWGATWSQTCGGSILNEMFVLSAAHCFEGDLYSPSQRRIRAGSTYRNEGGVVKNVAREYNHPDYGVAATFDADITVVRLASFLTFTPVIQQTRIMVQGSLVPDNSPVIHAGWGDTIPDVESSSPVLRDVVIYTINNNFCRQRYLEANDPDLIITPNMICAGVLGVGGRDACQGDTGGPLYYGNILVGVASWGNSCADPYYPGVSTAVSAFTNWIIETAV